MQSKHGRSRRWLLVSAGLAALCLAILPATPARAQTPEDSAPIPGPLRSTGHFLLAEGYMVTVPSGAAVLPAGVTSLEVQQAFVNTFSLSDSLLAVVDDPQRGRRITPEEIVRLAPKSGKGVDFLIDGEVARTEIAVRRGIGHGVELSAVLPILHVGGGFLDSFIEGFHTTFGIQRSDRFAAEQGRYLVYLRSADRTVVRNVEPGWGLGDLELAAKVELPVRPVGFDLAAQGRLKLPFGDRNKLFSSGSADLGAELIGSRLFTRSGLYVQLAAVRQGRWKDLGGDASTVFTGSATWERRLFQHGAAVVQFAVSDSPFKNFRNSQLAERTYVGTLGWKQALSPRTTAYLAVNENLFNYDDTPDFGFLFGFVRVFR